MPSAYGLIWKPPAFFVTPAPQWTIEPDIECIKATIAAHLSKDGDVVEISLLASATLHKTYEITTTQATYDIRVMLPIEMPFQVESEIATMKYMSTLYPQYITEVIAYNPRSTDPLGFPWILSLHAEGQTVHDQWRYFSRDNKENFVTQLAAVNATVFEHRFDSIGSLFIDRTVPGKTIGVSFRPGCLLEDRQTYIGHLLAVKPLGNSFEWLDRRLRQDLRGLEDDEARIRKNEDSEDFQDDLESVQRRFHIGRQLLELLPVMFSSTAAETTCLSLAHLNGNDIIVNSNGDIIALHNWGYTSTKPLWFTCQSPAFLYHFDQNFEPCDEDKDEDYWTDMKNYEMYNEYNSMFIDKVGEMQPRWKEIFLAAKAEREFEEAVMDLRHGYGSEDLVWLPKLKNWLETRGSLDLSQPRVIEGYSSRCFDINEWAGVETP